MVNNVSKSPAAPAAPTVAVAMSGGVDSAVAALLLREQGYNCFGTTMKLCRPGESEREAQAERDIADARAVADAIGLRHTAVDLSERFEETVIADFVSAYEHGETPCPCVLCNKVIKFGALLEHVQGDGANMLATGHYARIERSGDRYLLRRASDRSKDQSYMLCLLDQHRLSHILFPLGELSKAQVRELASAAGLAARRFAGYMLCSERALYRLHHIAYRKELPVRGFYRARRQHRRHASRYYRLYSRSAARSRAVAARTAVRQPYKPGGEPRISLPQ